MAKINMDSFVLQSEAGDQWFVCKLTGKKSATGQLEHEIIQVRYSEQEANNYIVEKKKEAMSLFKKKVA